MILSVIITILTFIFMNNILNFFGATSDILGSCRQYTTAFMLGFPLYVTGLMLIFI